MSKSPNSTEAKESPPENNYTAVSPSSPSDSPAETTPDPASNANEAKNDPGPDNKPVEADADDSPESESPNVSESETTADANSDSDQTTETTSEADEDAPAFADVTEDAAAPLNIVATRQRLNDLFSQMTSIASEAVLHFSANKMWTRMVDPANVAALEAQINASGFESFSAGEYRLGLDVEFIEDIINSFDKDTIVNISATNNHKIAIEGDGLKFTVAPIDPDTIRSADQVPEIELETSVTTDQQTLSRFLDAISVLSPQTATFELSETGLTGHATTDTDRTTVEIEPSDAITPPGSDINPFESIYDSEYLKLLINNIPNDNLTLRFGENLPMKAKGDYGDDIGSWEMVIAPRIENE